MDKIDPIRMAERRPITFAARDGLALTGYLTLPSRQGSARLPMVLLPHDGPTGSNDWFFDTDAQFLASRSYAVLQVNYRGSSGRGQFQVAGHKGVRDQLNLPNQAQFKRNTLDKAGRSPEWFVETAERHPNYSPKRQQAFYERLEAFLGKHLAQ